MFDIFGYKIKTPHILIAILLLGVLLRFWGLGSSEFFHDEGFYAFRSAGFLDYIQNEDQTTPIQWFKNTALPKWTSLSFHDHPPLFFLVQNFFFKIFGISLLAARLPSAIAGVLAIYLVYAISKDFFINRISGLIAASLFAFSLIGVWAARSSLIESLQIFLILLNIYYFFRFTKDERHWKLFGLTLGLCFLTKYTGIFLVPVYAAYLLIFQRRSFTRRELYFALALAAIIFSPVLIYNFYLWQTTGHFDLQFSYLFRQAAPEWRVSLGKTQDPFSEIISNLSLMYSIPFLLVSLAGIGYAGYRAYDFWKQPTDRRKVLPGANFPVFWLLNIVFITLMLAAVGSAFRFIVLYAVPAIMLIAFLVDRLFSRFSREVFLTILICLFLAYELFFATDIFRTFPDFGVVKLDNYFNSVFEGKRSLDLPASSNPHLDKIIKSYALKIPPAEKPVIIIYDGNIGLSPRLWLFARRNYYEGIPAFNVDQFKNFLQSGVERLQNYDIYFVKASGSTILNPLFHGSTAEEFERFLTKDNNLTPVNQVYGYNNLLMFTVYKFSF